MRKFNATREFARRNAQKVAAIAGKVSAGAAVALVTAQAHATSVIDAATKTAITAGFTDMKDTLSDLLGVSFPYIIGATVLVMSPQLVKGFLHMMGKK